MHILAIPSWYPSKKNPYNGNFIERHLSLIAKEHSLTVLIFESHASQETLITTDRINNYTEIRVFFSKKNAKISNLISLRKAFNQVKEQIQHVDFIHVHVILESGIIGLWAKKQFRKPLLITEHASYLFRENYKKLAFIQKQLIKRCIFKAKTISCVSEILKQELNYLFPKKEIYITPNLISQELFTISTTKKANKMLKCIHISTLEKVKNVSKIIEGFELFNQENNLFELTIIAEKVNFDISNQIENSSIKDKIKLVGPLSTIEVAERLKNSDVMILLSSYETFSCVIAESWASGIPVISTPVGIAKSMNSDCGILVKEVNPVELKLALIQFEKNRDSYNKEVIRENSIPFNAENVLKSFEQFYVKSC